MARLTEINQLQEIRLRAIKGEFSLPVASLAAAPRESDRMALAFT